MKSQKSKNVIPLLERIFFEISCFGLFIGFPFKGNIKRKIALREKWNLISELRNGYINNINIEYLTNGIFYIQRKNSKNNVYFYLVDHTYTPSYSSVRIPPKQNSHNPKLINLYLCKLTHVEMLTIRKYPYLTHWALYDRENRCEEFFSKYNDYLTQMLLVEIIEYLNPIILRQSKREEKLKNLIKNESIS